ncbi:MAG: transcription-repair coupling factor [bacterium]|nr:MAG: transcription-repair coupling factor [bacterium]
MWEDLRQRLEKLSAYVRLRDELMRGSTEVAASGLAGSARSLVLSTLAPGLEKPLIIVAPDPVKVQDVAGDLEIFGLDGVVIYPEDEILPYDYHDPDRDCTGMQMKALEALCGGECRVLVCTLRAMLKKVLPPRRFRELLIGLNKGEENDPLSLAEDLVGLGYERHGIVEIKGQFALRGGILDIFAVGEENPIRMEFDGDEIYSMREFDIETQRSMTERDRLRIHPLHHLAPKPEDIDRFRAELETAAAGMGGEDRARILLPAERLERGISFFGMENYAAALHEMVPIFEYFDGTPLVVVFDAEDVEETRNGFRNEVSLRFERSREEGHRYPPPESIYIGEEELERFLEGTKRLSFRSIAWERSVRFASGSPGDFRRNLKGLVTEVKRELAAGTRVYLFCANAFQRDRAEEVLPEVALDIDFPIGGLSSGFRWPELGVLFLSEEEVFGRYHRPYHVPRARSRSLSYDSSHFKPGDFVVHLNHGVGRYMGLRVLEIDGGSTECLDIRYEGGDHLFIPVAKLKMVEKYVAAEGAEPTLDRLGSAAWARARERARRSAERIARDLLEVYAARQIAEGFAYPADKPWQKQLEASFPYEETEHQIQSTAEVKADMESLRPMDRLLCGDVGFGKTEVAIRAAFKTVLSGKQCALLVPTTVLAMQHYNTISERLGGFPVNVGMLSRFISPAQQKREVGEITEGKVDIVVGTHRLLSKDVGFKDLGLVIVDEEHRFGVRHKEAFKKMKRSVDVLSMTATPIPRTLSMAISGIRDISTIDTPPRNRLPIHTEILPFDDDRIREAVMREVARGGQVFFVHNRVQSIAVIEGYLRRLLPERVRVSHAHGQMRERELEGIMIDFLERKFEVLVCTMIIEAGLDFPNVNTIIINRADKFGLAQLYQLRGRVGRSDRKAYAYLLVPRGRTLSPAAIKRLRAITEFDYLGAGYRLAMRDLEIRGAGNLLGHQQSGHINAVGLDLYTRMLREEVARLKGEPPPEEREVRITLPIPCYLPDQYIPDSEERMDIYRRLTRATDVAQVEEMRGELRDRFGPLPEPAENIVRLVGMKARARAVGIERVELNENAALRITFFEETVPHRECLAGIAEQFAGRITFHTERGFALSIRSGEAGKPADSPGMRPGDEQGACRITDIESLLNLLEFYDT